MDLLLLRERERKQTIVAGKQYFLWPAHSANCRQIFSVRADSPLPTHFYYTFLRESFCCLTSHCSSVNKQLSLLNEYFVELNQFGERSGLSHWRAYVWERLTVVCLQHYRQISSTNEQVQQVALLRRGRTILLRACVIPDVLCLMSDGIRLGHNKEYDCKLHGFYPSTW